MNFNGTQGFVGAPEFSGGFVAAGQHVPTEYDLRHGDKMMMIRMLGAGNGRVKGIDLDGQTIVREGIPWFVDPNLESAVTTSLVYAGKARKDANKALMSGLYGLPLPLPGTGGGRTSSITEPVYSAKCTDGICVRSGRSGRSGAWNEYIGTPKPRKSAGLVKGTNVFGLGDALPSSKLVTIRARPAARTAPKVTVLFVTVEEMDESVIESKIDSAYECHFVTLCDGFGNLRDIRKIVSEFVDADIVMVQNEALVVFAGLYTMGLDKFYSKVVVVDGTCNTTVLTQPLPVGKFGEVIFLNPTESGTPKIGDETLAAYTRQSGYMRSIFDHDSSATLIEILNRAWSNCFFYE